MFPHVAHVRISFSRQLGGGFCRICQMGVSLDDMPADLAPAGWDSVFHRGSDGFDGTAVWAGFGFASCTWLAVTGNRSGAKI